jgi:hypothetical protein
MYAINSQRKSKLPSGFRVCSGFHMQGVPFTQQCLKKITAVTSNILLKLYNNNRRLFCGVHGSQKNDNDVGR